MSVSYDLYLVRSPLQYMAACSARSYSKSGSLLVIEFEQVLTSNSSRQLSAVLDPSIWDKVIVIYSITRWRRLLSTWHMYLALAKFKIKRIFIGEYRDIHFHLISSSFQARARYLLDDGATTIFVQREYLVKARPYPDFLGLSFKQVLYYTILHLGFPSVDRFRLKYNLITEFRLDFMKRRGQAVLSSPVKKLVATYPLDELWLFGSKYSDTQLMTIADEMKYLQESVKILRRFQLPLVYIPHRGEEQEKLERIKSIGIEVRSLGIPVEKFIEKEGGCPRVIAAAWSTVLTTLPNRCAFESVICIGIPLELFCDSVRARANLIYDYYRAIKSVEMIDLDLNSDSVSSK